MFISPTDCPFYLITKASLSLTNALKAELANCGLKDVKPAYLGALMCLWTVDGLDEMLSKTGCADGMKLTDLGRCAGLEPSTMTGLIDRMERDGLVYRSADPRDRRAQIVNLTEVGMQIRTQVFQAVDQMLQTSFKGIAPDEMQTIIQALRKVLTNTNRRNP